MDVPALLREACERAKVSPSELACRAGSSSGAISQLLRGRVSPTVRTLDRLLAGVGLQLRVTLEPLLADVDAQVDALLTGQAGVDVAEIERLVEQASCELSWNVEDEESGQVRREHGRLSWALDGATALNVHGLACPTEALGVVLAFDEAARAWLTGGLVRGTAPGEVVGWWSATLAQARAALSELAVGRYGVLTLRVVDELPVPLLVQLPGSALVVPVVSVDEVERAHPDVAEVLARLRARRSAEGRT